jgi:3-oxoadipate enol-lactonase
VTVGLHARDTGGEGEAVVLAHAIGLDHRMWDLLVEALSPRYRVVALDARGHGKSPVPPRPYSLAAMADDAAALLDRLGIRRAHWVGLSMGGMVGQAFALAHPGRLVRLVLANTTSSYGPEGPANWRARIKLVEDGGLAAIRDAVEARYFSEDFRKRHADVVATTMARFMESPAQGYLGCCDAIAELDYSRDLAHIAAPTLVIAGGADIGTPVAMHEALASAIPGARLTVIDGAAHLSATERPREFADLVAEFLQA